MSDWCKWEVVLSPEEETELDLELDESFPAHLVITIEVEGEPDTRCSIKVEGSRPNDRWVTSQKRCAPPLSCGEAFLTAGAWNLVLHSTQRDWAWHSPEPLLLSSGERRELNLVLRRHPGTLRFVDEATGEPLVDRSILWGLAKSEPRRSLFGPTGLAPLETDDRGEATLRLPPSEFVFRLDGTPESSAVSVRWSEAGPDRVDVALKE